MDQLTLGDRFWSLTLKGVKLIFHFFHHRPSLAISILLHLALLICLGYFIILPTSQAPDRRFLPVVEDSGNQNSKPEESLPSIEEIDDNVTMVGGGITDRTLPDIPTQGSPIPNTVMGVGINAPIVIPFGVENGPPAGLSQGGSSAKPIKNKRTGKLFGLEVQTGNAGLIVFLDKSDSMKAVAERVQKLIEQDFPDAMCIELSGALFCNEANLDKLGKNKKIGEPLLGYYRSSLAKSIIPLGTDYLQNCSKLPESIYMMSDFEDYVDFPSLNEFGALLVEKKVKFFAHSVGQRPPAAVVRICQLTGGAVLVLPSEKLPKMSGENE